MSDSKKEKKRNLQDKETEDIRGGMKIVYVDDNPEESSWWEKFLKLFFKT